MDALMLDGNAVAGLLREVFAVEMTTAIERATRAARPTRSGRSMSFGAPASSCAARTATTPS